MNTLELTHPTTTEELMETAIYFGKDTKRKRSIFFKQWITDLDYVIDHIEPQLESKVIAHHLGERLSSIDLANYKAERSLIIDNFLDLIN